ncbi:ATP-binding cassette domain-containing protein [Streptomyces sp. NPDC046557]|uniref:ATP-binding cassette domain-containing protein n=1 Tax=Streptomyces sp. NPDC046557 TaxID=3155372 RepID=UPI0033D2AAEA
MTTPQEVLVHCQDVARTYSSGPAAVVAVHGATCQVRAGDRIAITGPSSSGKSTLLHLMAALEKHATGQVTWPGLAGGPVASQVGVPGRPGTARRRRRGPGTGPGSTSRAGSAPAPGHPRRSG